MPLPYADLTIAGLFLKKLLIEKVDHMSEDDREMLLKATGEALKKAS